mmetsp:Transcript_30364/g.97113  ORF Transcript_30364/g.97113 Transcript_30364/m.97113 type:complete len:372 (+) Transcript_30364:2-1117(+)
MPPALLYAVLGSFLAGRLGEALSLRASRGSADEKSFFMCSLGDERVDFGPPPLQLARQTQELARQSFLRLLDTGPLTETLCVSRHRCCKIPGRVLEQPRALRAFEWRLLHQKDEGVVTDVANPRSVYCNANFTQECLEITERLPPLRTGERRVLAIGQEDNLLSTTRREVQALADSGKYSRVLYEGKDVRMPGVRSLPQCLNSWYLAKDGNRSMLEAVRRARLGAKDRAVLAAWGYQWGKLDRQLESRRQAVRFTNHSCLVQRHMYRPEEYWAELARHRFLLAPTGNSIFTPKMMEALLVLTIPIAQREPDGGAWEELRDRYGWPLVIVDRWEEITTENLQRWWAELSPKLEEARLHLTADYWLDRVMNGD